jgi:hypothetical protein
VGYEDEKNENILRQIKEVILKTAKFKPLGNSSYKELIDVWGTDEIEKVDVGLIHKGMFYVVCGEWLCGMSSV